MTTPTELTFWTWVPDIENEVELFEEKYPAIDVKVENVGQGLPHYQKLRSAIEAGEGAPDVAQIEYQYIPSFVLPESLLDLTPYGADDLVGRLRRLGVEPGLARRARSGRSRRTSDPMGNLYREDILTQAGITEPPATWDDYATAAKAVKETTGSYISNLGRHPGRPDDRLLLAGGRQAVRLRRQGDGQRSTSTATRPSRSRDYWTELIQARPHLDRRRLQRRVVPGPRERQVRRLADRGVGADLPAGHGRGHLGPVARCSAAAVGRRATRSRATGAVRPTPCSQSSENPIAAYELAKFINNDEESAMKLATEQFLFPPQVSVLEDPAFVDQESEFYGGQKVNELFADISTTVDTDFQWVPFMDYVYSTYEETMGTVIADKGDISAALDIWQDQLVKYAEDQGFTVE